MSGQRRSIFLQSKQIKLETFHLYSDYLLKLLCKCEMTRTTNSLSLK